MRDVNLALFDFDYDLTWMTFFLSPQEHVYGRYGGRDANSDEGRTSLAGLRYALDAALRQHASGPPAPDRPAPARFTVADLPSFRRLPANACVHCHQVYDLRRESLQAAGKWSLDEVWVYPLPENAGLSLEVDRGDRIARVAARSPAERAGLRAGDCLTRVGGLRIASIADVQYALHRAKAVRSLEVAWQRDGQERTAKLELPEGWRETDVSWRWSLRGIDPAPPLRGDDLSAEEKAVLGLSPSRLAFRQGPFVGAIAEHAGVRQNDLVLGVDGKRLEMTARQFGAYVRLRYRVGDRVTFNLLRDGRPLDVVLTLTGRAQ